MAGTCCFHQCCCCVWLHGTVKFGRKCGQIIVELRFECLIQRRPQSRLKQFHHDHIVRQHVMLSCLESRTLADHQNAHWELIMYQDRTRCVERFTRAPLRINSFKHMTRLSRAAIVKAVIPCTYKVPQQLFCSRIVSEVYIFQVETGSVHQKRPSCFQISVRTCNH